MIVLMRRLLLATVAFLVVLAAPAGAVPAINVFIGSTTIPTGFGATANLWVDSTGGTCTRQGTASAYSDPAACATPQAAYAAASAGDTVRVKSGSYGAVTFAARALGQPSVNFYADNGTVTFTALDTEGADNLKFYSRTGQRDWSGSSVTNANNWFSSGAQCVESHDIAMVGLTLTQSFANGKDIALMCNAHGWTFRNIDVCCDTSGDKPINIDGWWVDTNGNSWQSSDLVFEQGIVHSQTMANTTDHTELFWDLGPQSLVLRNLHLYGSKSGSGAINLSDTGSAMTPANFMLENTIIEPASDFDGTYSGISCGPGQVLENQAYLGVNFIRNNLFDGTFCQTANGSAATTMTWTNNIGNRLCGGGDPPVMTSWTLAKNRWNGGTCGGTDVSDANVLASARYTNAPTITDSGQNTQAASLISGNWHYTSTGATAYQDAGAATPGLPFDADYAPHSATVDAGPYEYGATAPTDLPPTANFLTPAAGTNVTWDASASVDPEGAIVSYLWDWNNDGTVDTTTSSATTTHTTSIGDVVSLQVTDSAGNTSAAKIVKVLA